MPDERLQPYDGLARWLGDSADDPSMPSPPSHDAPHPRRHRLRVAALTLPWAVVALVLLTTATGDHAAAPPTRGPIAAGDHGTPPPAAGGPSEASGAGARTASGTTGTPATGGAGAPPHGAGATAVALVRDAVTGTRGDSTRAVDVATPGAARALDDHRWLVRVHAVVLRGDRRRWRSATHEVWAVPLAVRDGVVSGLDDPWRVERRRPRIAAPAWAPAQVDRAAVRAALAEAGARPAGDLDPRRHASLPGIVRVRTAGRGGDHVWLRTRPTMEVLGTAPSRDDAR